LKEIIFEILFIIGTTIAAGLIWYGLLHLIYVLTFKKIVDRTNKAVYEMQHNIELCETMSPEERKEFLEKKQIEVIEELRDSLY
jgi:hypothetical protein